MSGFLHDAVRDGGIDVLSAATNELRICHTLPTTRAAAITNSVATKATPGPVISAAADGTPDGRAVSVAAITDGNVDTTHAAAAFWAIIDGTILLAAEALVAPQGVTAGNTFTLGGFTIRMPDQP